MSKEKLFYVGIKALITNDEDKILVFLADVSDHRKVTEPYWDLPGGRIDKGETVLQTLRREIEEETGVTELVSHEFITSVVSNHEIPIEDEVIGLVLMVYKVTIPKNSKITMSKEHTTYEWVDRAEAKRRLAHKYPKEFTDQL